MKETVVAFGIEFDQKVEIAPLRIEGSSGCGPEQLQLAHAVAAAQGGNLRELWVNEARHGRLRGNYATNPSLMAIGLEAAHIKWFQARGRDVVPNGLVVSLAAPQDLRPRRVHRAAGEPPDRVQPPPPPNGRRRHQSEAAGSPRRRPDSTARQGMPAAPGVSGVAQGGGVQGAGAGVAGANCREPLLPRNSSSIEESAQQFVAAYLLMSGNVSEDCGQCADSQRIVKRYGDVMLGRARRCEPQGTACLGCRAL